MSYRRRHRWLRRLAVGLAFAAFAAPAAAKLDESGGLNHDSALVVGEDALGKSLASAPSSAPFVQGVSDFPRAAAQFPLATRPDNRSDRFAHSDAAASGSGVLSSGTDWNEGLALGLGAVVLALALGMALGYLSRPRLAGTH